jgi:hypothetical protein
VFSIVSRGGHGEPPYEVILTSTNGNRVAEADGGKPAGDAAQWAVGCTEY